MRDLSKRLDRLEAFARRAIPLPPDDSDARMRFWQTLVDAYPVPDLDTDHMSVAEMVATAARHHPELRDDLEALATADGCRGTLGRRLLALVGRMAPAADRAV